MLHSGRLSSTTSEIFDPIIKANVRSDQKVHIRIAWSNPDLYKPLIRSTLWDKFMNQGVKRMLDGFRIYAWKFLVLIVVCLPMVVNQGALREVMAADPSPESLINCDIQQGPCRKEFSGMTVTLDIHPKPVKAMKDLKFEVTVSGGKGTTAPYIDLGMPGMNMGPNRVELRRVKDNVFEGQGIIVRCPSGRRTWIATVTLPEVGKVEFVFDVIY